MSVRVAIESFMAGCSIRWAIHLEFHGVKSVGYPCPNCTRRLKTNAREHWPLTPHEETSNVKMVYLSLESPPGRPGTDGITCYEGGLLLVILT